MVCSFNERFPLPSHHHDTQRLESGRVVGADDGLCRKHGIVGAEMRGVFGRLFDGFHFLFASGVVEGADDYGLAE